MKLQKLLSYTRRAIDDYAMIQENDKIAIGISGGKDSLTLLYAMANLRRFYPIPFTLEAITVDLGFPDMNFEPISQLCAELNVPYTIVKTNIAEIVFDYRKESSPCSLCAKMRKGALNDKIVELGCNKIAYAHHKDDMIETMFLSLLYEGRIHTFSPVTYLDRMQLTLIRPLMYVSEGEIKDFENAMALPVAKSKCPADGYTKRQYAKELVYQLHKENPGCKDKIFSAIQNAGIKGWPEKHTRE